jgi:hypothetical protein
VVVLAIESFCVDGILLRSAINRLRAINE